MRNDPLKEVPLLRLAVCMMVGIVAGDSWPMAPWPLFGGLAVLVAMALLARPWALVQSGLIALACVALGMLLISRHRQAMAADWPDALVDYEAVVISDPVEKPKTMAVDLLLPSSGRRLKAYIAKDDRSRRLHVGDGLQIRSRIEQPGDWRQGAFSYRRYLEVHGFTGRSYIASWNWQRARVSLKSLSLLERTRLYFLRQRSLLLDRLRHDRPADDTYAVVAAMALGDKSALSGDLKAVYAQTGASHVLALSGLHLGIIYSLLSLLVVGRRWRVVSQVLVVLAVWAFVLLVGLSVSVVRSAVMISAYALLSLGHRQRMSVNTLAFTAIAMLLANPLALFDVGFQLSYMAVLSILVLMPLFEGLVSAEWLMGHRLLRWGWGLMAVSCAAQVGTAPLVAYHFGRLPVYFLLTNLLVIPAATAILYLSMVVLAVPSCAFLLYNIVAWLNRALGWLARLPYASIEGLYPSMLQTAMVYVVIMAVYLLVRQLLSLRPGHVRQT